MNVATNLLANIVSCLITLNDTFSIEPLFRPYVNVNMTSWKVFDDDQKIVVLLKEDITFKVSIIDDDEHQANIKRYKGDGILFKGNFMHKGVLTLDKMFDFE